ncbi:MAG: FHA domain-containing protein [Nanoarchaeota archaeon]
MELMELTVRFLKADDIKMLSNPLFKSHLFLVKEGLVRVLKFPFLIGRIEPSHLLVSNASISRKHVEIYTEGLFFKKYFVKDVGSKNGTIILRGGQIIELTAQKGVQLENEDILSMGLGVKFKVLI